MEAPTPCHARLINSLDDGVVDAWAGAPKLTSPPIPAAKLREKVEILRE